MKWTKYYDQEDNLVYEARSPYHDDGEPFYWRIKRLRVKGGPKWVECSTRELWAGDEPRSWETLGKAQFEMGKAHAAILQSIADEETP